MDRRNFFREASIAVANAVLGDVAFGNGTSSATHFSLKIGIATIELAPGKSVKTVCYNGQVPGPVLRMREGIPVTVDVENESTSEELVHWHGLHIASVPDGAAEERSPTISPGGHLRYSFTPEPAGTRWYHTHTTAMSDLERATYSGQFGFLMIEPKTEPNFYDQEVLLAIHHWEPSLMRRNVGAKECSCIAYQYASFNDKLLGAGEPIRVRQGERVLFRFLNASATEDVMLALPGHRFIVIALDGNPVPNPASVEVLALGVGERVDAVVEMKSPGIWVLGSVSDAERRIGLGTVVEYANQTGEPQWIAPPMSDWSYSLFAKPDNSESTEEAEVISMLFNNVALGADGIEQWTINGKSFDQLEPLEVRKGRRYRFRFINASGYALPVHLQRHSFELKHIAQVPVSGLWKDTVSVGRYSYAEAEFVANNPGHTLFHCHHQLHMDNGFMQSIRYV